MNSDHSCDPCEVHMPILFCLAVLVLLFALYYAAAGTKYGKATQGSMLMSNLAILAASVQSVYITLSFFPELPGGTHWIVRTTEVFMFRFDSFSPSCNFGESLGSRMFFGSMPPALIFCGYAVLAPVMIMLTKPLQRFGYPGLKIDILINTIGKLLQTLYVFLCKQALAYLVVTEHPAGPATLAEYTDIIFLSDEHLSMGWLAALVILFYVVGIYAGIAYAVVRAPAKSADVNFRNRWKFIFVRWRPHKWYWGLLLLLRNLCIALVPVVISSNAMHQVAAFTVVVSIYMLAEAQFLPWVSYTNNYVSVGMSLLMILIAIGGLNPPTNGAQQPYFLSTCYGLVWALFVLGSVHVLVAGLPMFRSGDANRYSRILHDLAGVSQGITSRLPEDYVKGDSLEWIDNVLQKLSDYDIRALSHTLDLMCHDVLQEKDMTMRSSNSFRVDSSGIEVPAARTSSFERSQNSLDSVWAAHAATAGLENSEQLSPGAPMPRLLGSMSASPSPQDSSDNYCKV